MFREPRWWYHYWKRKGHISKGLESAYRKIDSSYLYDNREVAFNAGEENIVHRYKINLFENYALIRPYFDQSDKGYVIPIESTSCNYGGKRHWFLCPNPKCNKRVKILYLCNMLFLCRNCLRLGYSSQVREPHMRYLYMKDKIEELLKRKGGDVYTRPRYMHQKTFDELRDKYWDYEDKIDQYLMKHYPLFIE